MKQPYKEQKSVKIPNIWVELVACIILVAIAIAIGYLLFNYAALVEFRELN